MNGTQPAAGRLNTALQPPLTLGILADTHVPERAHRLHPQVIPAFRRARVAALLHAGDINDPNLLSELAQVGPVFAVRGNRDWPALRRLPLQLCLQFGTIKIGLAHGHGGVFPYVVDRLQFMREGYRLNRYLPRLRAAFPDAQVIVFGHTHFTVNRWIDGRLFFNPGSPHFPEPRQDHTPPSVGLLHLEPGGALSGEIVNLDPLPS